MAPSSSEPVEPDVFVIQGFVIEAYPSISDVPYASVSEQRGRTPKTSENERFDELYGRCRTCMGHKSGEQLLLCDDCDRGFHMTCLVPVLRDVPKGEWHCPKCTRDRRYSIHARAAAVVNLRKVLNDIQTRASLPPKLQLKYLDIAGPTVKCTRVFATNHSTSQQLESTALKPILQRSWKTLPPKFRMKHRRERQIRASRNPPPPNEPDSSVICKKITTKSVQKRVRNLCRLTDDLIPMTDRLANTQMTESLYRLQTRLLRSREDVEAGVAATRTSHNALSRAKRKGRLDTRPQTVRICHCVNQCSCAKGNQNPPPLKRMRSASEKNPNRVMLSAPDPPEVQRMLNRGRSHLSKG